MKSIARTNQGQVICTNCVMDRSDPDIQFDLRGTCNHCRSYDQIVKEAYLQENGRGFPIQIDRKSL